MDLSDPIVNIEQAFVQLTYSIKLLTYVERRQITHGEFDSDVQINLECEPLVFGADAFKTYDDIILATQNNYTLTLGFTAITLDTSMTEAGLCSDLPKDSPHRDLRALVYMLRCAFAHNMMHPKWEAKGHFKRTLILELFNERLEVNVASLHGLQFQDLHIGGMGKYFEIKNQVLHLLRIS